MTDAEVIFTPAADKPDKFDSGDSVRRTLLGRTRVLVALALAFCTQVGNANTVLVTGANSGIGYEFARQYAELGSTVIATHRRREIPENLDRLSELYPGKVLVEFLDVRDRESIDNLASKYQGEPIDILINNAAVAGSLLFGDQQAFGSLNYSLFDLFFHTNVMGPLMVTEALMPNIRASDRKLVVAISSRSGSIGAGVVDGKGGIFYRTSKTALNMAMANVAEAVRPFGVTVVLLHPGAVATERLLQLDLPDTVVLMPPEESISAMITLIETLGLSKSGSFLDFKGNTLEW